MPSVPGLLDRLRGLVTRRSAPRDDEARLRLEVEQWLRTPRLRRLEVTQSELTNLDALTRILERRGDAGGACELMQRAFDGRLSQMPPHSTVRQAGRLAMLVAKTSELAEAEALLRRHRQRVTRAPGDDGIAVRAIEHALGSVLQWAGDFDGARRAWAGPDAAPGQAEQPPGAPYRNAQPVVPEPGGLEDADLQLARLEIDLEHFEEAETLLERVQRSQRVLGMITDLYVGTLERQRGALPRAHAIYDRCAAQMDALSIPLDDGLRCTLALARARVLMAEDRWDEAEGLALDALLGYSKASGDDAEVLVPVLAELAVIWAALDRADDSVRAAKRALELAERWCCGALVFSDTLVATAIAHFDRDPDTTLRALQSADARLAAGMPRTNQRRVRIERLQRWLGASVS